MKIDNKFTPGDFVYLVTDAEQEKRIVTAIKICGDGGLLYELSSGTSSSEHYDFEISDKEDVLTKVK